MSSEEELAKGSIFRPTSSLSDTPYETSASPDSVDAIYLHHTQRPILLLQKEVVAQISQSSPLACDHQVGAVCDDPEW
jgi:hypothetical protein